MYVLCRDKRYFVLRNGGLVVINRINIGSTIKIKKRIIKTSNRGERFSEDQDTKLCINAWSVR